ncbi:MFS general substrate transporter [Suillus spraguei]|nr:MFS general substrate transporter [Suillus spraguei]
MASVTYRASGFWADRMSYLEDTEQGTDDVEVDLDAECDKRTPLDKTIDRIGMGSYQWTLLSLCGFGWMADNMWIQAVAIILPRVQQHFSVPDNYIGTLSSSMFAGMMFGAVGWGTCSDLLGRSAAFNATLFFTALFGILSSFAWSFQSLCILLFFLGSAVGGSMPTDGTLLLEHMPNGKQYLVTALSVFFSFGSVLSAGVALIVIPSRSCPPNEPCDVVTQNTGWQFMLVSLGVITLSMFIARMVFFRLHESPRYLVHAGRHQEALESLQLISRFNGSELPIDLEDVDDRPPPICEADAAAGERLPRSSPNNETFDAGADGSTSSDQNGTKVYQSMAEATHDALDGHLFVTPVGEVPPRGQSLARGHHSRSSSRDSDVLPRWVRRPLLAWLDRWFRTTVLMCGIWFFMSLAYTMFNVYLPKLLETGSSDDNSTKSLKDSLWDVLIFTMGGCPGAILGAYMVESSLGRRGSLAATTFVTAFFCIVFALVRSAFLVRVSSVGISLSATTMYAVLYGWTPEIFGTKVRGTACGIASALSRIGGMIAPLLGGALLVLNRGFPVWTSVVVYVITGVFVLLLHESTGNINGSAERSFVH